MSNANGPTQEFRVASKYGLDVRADADSGSALVGTLGNGEKVIGDEVKANPEDGRKWVHIRAGGLEGYVRQEFLR